MSSPITNLKVQSIPNPGPLQEVGWFYLSQDLNQSVGGNYIYVGYQTGTGVPVTSLNFFDTNNAQQGPQVGWQHWDPTDLNQGAGGKYIYMEWNTGETGKEPIINIMFLATSQDTPPSIGGWIPTGVDLNKGSGGLYIWAYYSTIVSPGSK
ncbi:MAG: hypothetical protein F6K26_03270 [Moorea sp. SIO2I5]|nr:hypothetical protein [Moorena sp. SIO2I5]